MKSFYTVVLLVMVSILVNCAASVPALTEKGRAVTVGKSDPGSSYREIGPIEGVHGQGCGGFGVRGSYTGAMVKLKNTAGLIHADFVQIYTITEPHLAGGCFDNKYIIRGVAYKKR